MKADLRTRQAELAGSLFLPEAVRQHGKATCPQERHWSKLKHVTWFATASHSTCEVPSMRVFSAAFVPVSLLLLATPAFAVVHPHHHSSTQAMMHHSSANRSHHAEHAATEHFVPSISPERATEIQSALISKGYLTGTPSGVWDASSISAMQKLQGDNGWQTKLIPDSRALIKLGLGPNSSPVHPVSPNTVTPSTVANAQTAPAY